MVMYSAWVPERMPVVPNTVAHLELRCHYVYGIHHAGHPWPRMMGAFGLKRPKMKLHHEGPPCAGAHAAGDGGGGVDAGCASVVLGLGRSTWAMESTSGLL